jgi:long-chain acyl-CoA synthetase
VLADAEPRLLLVDEVTQWSALAPFRSRFPGLATVICVAAAGPEKTEAVSLEAWLPSAAAAPDPSVAPDTLASITYTSGTTGRPKGVMLTHANLVFAASAVLRRIAGRTDDVFLSFLPLAHSLERSVGYYVPLACGAELAFARSVRDLPDDLRTIRPTILVAVPRIYERAWQRVEETLADRRFGRGLLRWLVSPEGGGRGFSSLIRRAFVSLLIGPRLRAGFGGRLRVAVSGAAPLPAQICRGLRAAGLPLTEGYGLTEATGPATGELPERYVPGSVGRLLDGVELRTADSGEILIRSPGVMAGYWRRAKDTAEAIDAEGWLHTGDLGKIEYGRVFVFGRTRDTIVMSTGEKVSPAELEARIVADPLFEQAVILGDRRSYLVALVVLSEKLWRSFAEAHRREPGAMSGEAAERLLVERIAEITRDLPRYAQIRRVWPTPIPWTVENGLITVTLKPRREELARRFAADIERLYQAPAAPRRGTV